MNTKAYENFERKPIDYEDDLVIVYDDNTGNVVYKGIEDYEPMKYEDWIWNSSLKAYIFKNYIKICLDV